MIEKDYILQQKYLVSTYPNRNLTFVKGDGVYLIDKSGNKYLDMMSNYGVNILGYSNEVLNTGLKKQIDELTTLHCSFNNDVRSKCLQQLLSRIKKTGLENLDKVYFSNSGTEAIEAALKFASLATKKSRFIAFTGGYHGKTFGSLSATTSGDSKYQKPFQSNLLKFDFVKFGDYRQLRKVISERHAGVVMEPIQGEAGVVVPSKGFLIQVSKICKQNNIPLIIDEIQTGMGRTGYFVNVEQYVKDGFCCDMLCLAKGLGGGIPVGATIISRDINSKIVKGIHTSTLGGNPLAMQGIVSTLEELHEGIIENAKQVGLYFLGELNTLKSRYPKIIRGVSGQGLMIGVEVSIDPIEIVKKLQDNRLLVAPTSDNRFRFLPPLIIIQRDVDAAIEVLDRVLQSF
jgi:LysW-gamma-L-lysine/LysW-L-ornithine aminotransferase